MPAKLEGMEVKLKSDNKWQMRLNKGPWQDAPYPKLDVNEDEVGVFTFQIVGSGDVKFDPNNPFVEKQPDPSAPSDFKDQFIVLGKGTRDLTVIDVNGLNNGQPYAGGSYSYALQFTDGAPALDPIVTNMGCCRSFALSGTEAVVYSLVIAGAGALAAVGYRKWRAGRSPAAAAAGKAQK